jgi:hypothetical protein
MHRAASRIGERRYSLSGNDCEHFANWCATGVAISYQVVEVAGGDGDAGMTGQGGDGGDRHAGLLDGERVARHDHVPTRLTLMDQDYEHLRTDMATLFRHLGIQPGPAAA